MSGEIVSIDIDALPDTGGKGQWSKLHPMAQAKLKGEMFPKVLVAVRQANIDKIPTPCVVDVHLYFNGKSHAGGLDFDNLCICIGKLMLDPLCPDKFHTTKNGVRHRVGLNLIPDDTVEHIRGVIITRHPNSDRNHTVLNFEPPGERLRRQWEEAQAGHKARSERGRQRTLKEKEAKNAMG